MQVYVIDTCTASTQMNMYPGGLNHGQQDHSHSLPVSLILHLIDFDDGKLIKSNAYLHVYTSNNKLLLYSYDANKGRR